MKHLLDKQKIEWAFSALKTGAKKAIIYDESPARTSKNRLSVPCASKAYLSICSNFTYSMFQIGLLNTALLFEKKKGAENSIDFQRWNFCQAILSYLLLAAGYKSPDGKVLLSSLIQEAQKSDPDRLQHYMQEALDYFKLCLEACEKKQEK
ncbi:MAG: hypothetical protein KDC44_16855 [Phaeodactylibacter sp.]|nr:hypothetical protein [Phaeodactylibacter sp.]